MVGRGETEIYYSGNYSIRAEIKAKLVHLLIISFAPLSLKISFS